MGQKTDVIDFLTPEDESLLEAEQWPDPEPVDTSLLPVEQLPLELIPTPLRGWVEDVSHRMQVKADMVAVGVMVAVGALVGSGCGIRPKKNDDWLVIPNLWGGSSK